VGKGSARRGDPVAGVGSKACSHSRRLGRASTSGPFAVSDCVDQEGHGGGRPSGELSLTEGTSKTWPPESAPGFLKLGEQALIKRRPRGSRWNQVPEVAQPPCWPDAMGFRAEPLVSMRLGFHGRSIKLHPISVGPLEVDPSLPASVARST